MVDIDKWNCRGRVLTLTRPLVMGILNVTPDSFSDGGRHNGLDQAVAHTGRMLQEGAGIIDVGGESTRPGFTPVDVEEELRRVVPVIREIRKVFPDCVLSVDTMKAAVAQAALDAGADLVNDVSGSADPNMLDVVRTTGAGLVLMHGYAEHVGKPRTAKSGELGRWMVDGLRAILDEALAKGIPEQNICVDPGFGFGKRQGDNAEVLKAVPELVAVCGRPVLIGGSRKHFVNGLYPDEGGDLVKASVRFAVDALKRGGKVFRVHDVLETCAGINVALE